MSKDAVKEGILKRIESGEYSGGRKLPGARELAREFGVSFLTAQRSVSLLEQDGVLECLSRKGTFVRKDWKDRLIRNHIYFFREDFFWLPDFRGLLEKGLPELRLCSGFRQGMYELRTTFYLQCHHEEYMDLSNFLTEEMKTELSLEPFRGFRDLKGVLYGIPFIYSPRILLYRREKLKRCGLKEPRSGWKWKEFSDLLRCLCEKLPAHDVFKVEDSTWFYMNFIFRAGGKLLDRNSDGSLRVCLDDPKTVRGIEYIREFLWILRGGKDSETPPVFLLADRERYSSFSEEEKQEYGAVELPLMEGGNPVTAQATDLICIRKECCDLNQARAFVNFMTGESVQDYIGSCGYGIPIRRLSAEKSFRPDDPNDMLFEREEKNLATEYQVESTDLMESLYYAIRQIIHSGDDWRNELEKMSEIFRALFKIRTEMEKGKWQ